MMDILCGFKPKNEQEKVDVELTEKYHNLFNDIWTRDNTLCHLTSSAVIVNEDFTKILVIFHNIYKSWSWVGGHADGEHNLLNVALKETQEETGLDANEIKVLENTPISFEILPVASHLRRGKYVSCHTHLSVAYLFQAIEKSKIRILEEENSNIAWLPFDEFLSKSTEPHMIPVYTKIFKYIEENYKK